MKRIAIVGGGISGLAAAFALEGRRQAGESLEFVLYEAGPRFGGVLSTEQIDGCLTLRGKIGLEIGGIIPAVSSHHRGVGADGYGIVFSVRGKFSRVRNILPESDGDRSHVGSAFCGQGIIQSALENRKKQGCQNGGDYHHHEEFHQTETGRRFFSGRLLLRGDVHKQQG